MNRRTPSSRSTPSGFDTSANTSTISGPVLGFVPDTFEVLDHHDILEVLARSKTISTRGFGLVSRDCRCLAVVLLNAALKCSAIITINDVPDVFDDEAIAAIGDLLVNLPGEVSAIALAICSPSDPPAESDHVERLSTLCAPLSEVGIELRDIVECYPSGFSSLRADLIEHEAQRW
jgi:hypothetical protein